MSDALPAQPRSALVTGASSGIGRAIAERLVADRWTVTVIVRRPEAPQGTQVVNGDVRDPEVVARAITLATGGGGRLDGLVCAAGVPPSGPWDDADRWDHVLA